MMEYSVLIPDAESPHAHDVVYCLAAHERVRIHVLHSQHRNPLKHSRHVSSAKRLPPGTTDKEWLARVLAEIKRVQPDVLLPINEPAIRRCGLYLEELASECAVAPIPTPNQFAGAVDKATLAERMDDAGIPCPKTMGEREFLSMAEPQHRIPLPWILKATHGAFGHGTMKVSSESEIDGAFEQVKRSKRRYILQEFIQGEDAGCTVLCHEGVVVAYTLHRSVKPASTPFKPPLVIEFIHDSRAVNIVDKLVRVLRWNGIAHIDLRLRRRSGEPYILELNSRFEYSTVGSLVAGVNFPVLSCLTALGIDFPAPAYREGTFLLHDIPKISIRNRRMSWRWRWSRLPVVVADPLPYALRKIGYGSRWRP